MRLTYYAPMYAPPELTAEERRQAQRLEIAARILAAMVGGVWSDPSCERRESPVMPASPGFSRASRQLANVALGYADAMLVEACSGAVKWKDSDE